MGDAKKILFKLFLAVSICMGIFMAVNVSAKERRVVKVAYYLFDSFQEIDTEGNYQGYGYDYLKEIGQYTGWEYEFVSGTFSECFEMLLNGEIDLMGGLSEESVKSEALIFTDYSTMGTQSELYALADNNMLAYEDYENFNGMSVGIMKGNQQVKKLETLCEEKDFTITIVPYETQEELEKALQQKKVDSVFSTNISNLVENKIIEQFDEIPLYYATSKKNTELMQELNKAIRSVQNNAPFFSTQLYNKYFLKGATNNPAFTREELDYINEKKVIKIAYDPIWRPIESYDEETDSIVGMTEAVFDMISDYSGLEFEFVNSLNFKEALEKIKVGQVDMLTAFCCDYNWADKNNLYVSSPYLTSPMMKISPRKHADFVSEYEVIAVVEGRYTTEVLMKEVPEELIYRCDTIEECLDAIIKGKADACYINSYAASYYLADYKYTSLTSVNLAYLTENISAAIYKGGDARLLSVINKTLACIPNEVMDRIILDYSIPANKITLKGMMYADPIGFIITLSSIFIIIVGAMCTVLFINHKKNLKIRKYLIESDISHQRFEIALQHVVCEVFDYNFASQEINMMESEAKHLNTNSILKKGVYRLEDCNFVLPEYKDMFFKLFKRVKEGSLSENAIIKMIDLQGLERWKKVTLTSLKDDNGVSIRAVGTFEDMTEETEKEMELKEKAEIDFLTGIYNRRAIERIVEESIHSGDLKGQAVFLLDLDKFKKVNDVYGHIEGDKLLRTIAQTLRKLLNEDGIIGRLGGDEFIIYLSKMESYEKVQKLAASCCEEVRKIAKEKKEWKDITVSIGIAVAENEQEDFQKLYNKADLAVYKAKEEGRNCFVFYHSQL